MSLLAQISIVLIIVITAMILFRSNRGLRIASEEEEMLDSEIPRKEIKMLDSEICREEIESLDSESSGEEIEKPQERKTPSPKVLSEADISLLLLDEDKNPIRQVEIDHYPYTIGRDSRNDLVIPDLCIAKFHCEIVEEDGFPLLRDKGSINKIYSRGSLVDQLRLENKTNFYVGNQEILVKERVKRSKRTILAYHKERMQVG